LIKRIDFCSDLIPSPTWSECSIGQLANAFQHGLDICLNNVPQTIEPNILCGNGIVENDEQCDCGRSTEQVFDKTLKRFEPFMQFNSVMIPVCL